MMIGKVILFKKRAHLGAKFKAVRIEKGYTYDYLAHHACIEPIGLIHQFEDGVIDLPLNYIYALANILEISPRLLLRWIDQNKSFSFPCRVQNTDSTDS